jgi:hypothetical protein
MIGIPQGMQSAEQEERSRGGCKIPDTEVQDPAPLLFFFSAPPQHNTEHTPHLTAKERSGIWDNQPKKLKKWEIINSQDLKKSKPRFRS